MLQRLVFVTAGNLSEIVEYVLARPRGEREYFLVGKQVKPRTICLVHFVHKLVESEINLKMRELDLSYYVTVCTYIEQFSNPMPMSLGGRAAEEEKMASPATSRLRDYVLRLKTLFNGHLLHLPKLIFAGFCNSILWGAWIGLQPVS